MIKPNRLRRGDTVGVIAPAGPVHRENLFRGLSYLAKIGLKYKLGKFLFAENGYLAGTDEERLEDLMNMFCDHKIKAIICARGGYGTPRIAHKIDYKIIQNHPKIFWGYSDVTFLHNAFLQHSGLITFHGPMLASDIGKNTQFTHKEKFFAQLFKPTKLKYPWVNSIKEIVPGSAEGRLMGGNLTLLCSSLGTSFEIDTRGKILLIEEIEEEPRSIDRMMNQLYLAGKLQAASGILLGDFHDCVSKNPQSLELNEVLDYYATLSGTPTMKGFKIGHCTPHFSVPFGTRTRMNTNNLEVIIEDGVR